MKRPKTRNILLAFGLLMLVGGLISIQPAHTTPQSLLVWHDVLLGASLILIWLGSRRRSEHENRLIRHMGLLVPAAVLLWGLIYGAEALSPVSRLPELTTQISPWYALMLAAMALTSLWVLHLLKSLIFVEQAKSSGPLFTLMIIVMMIRALYFVSTPPHHIGMFRGWDEFSKSATEIILFVVFVLTVALNGFRAKWIHHLSRNQKVAVFFAGLFLNVIANVVAIQAPPPQGVVSEVLASVVRDISQLLLIYTSMGLLGVLFQLPSAGLMDRRMREIRFLQGLGATLGSMLNRDELLEKTVTLGRQVIGADAVWVELKEDDEYRLGFIDGLKEDVVAAVPPGLLTEIRQLMQKRDHVLLIKDIPRDRSIPDLRKHFKRTGALLAAEIRYKRRVLGTLYAVSFDRFGFMEESRGLFRAFADQAGVALENARLAQVTIDQQIYKEELRVAHDAQMRLLPQAMPDIPGASLAAYCATANEIGGDFYDFIPMGSQRVDIIIGDVSGKGASAAFYMAELKGVVQAVARHADCPKSILTEINDFVIQHFEKDTFVTMAYGIYYPEKSQLELARAGHPPVALVRQGKARWIEPPGLGLGLATNDRFDRTIQKSCQKLEPGDLLFFMTDGLIEARNEQEEEFDEHLLTDVLNQCRSQSAEAALDDVKRAMDTFTGNATRHDDVTMVALTVEGNEAINFAEGESQ